MIHNFANFYCINIFRVSSKKTPASANRSVFFCEIRIRLHGEPRISETGDFPRSRRFPITWARSTATPTLTRNNSAAIKTFQLAAFVCDAAPSRSRVLLRVRRVGNSARVNSEKNQKRKKDGFWAAKRNGAGDGFRGAGKQNGRAGGGTGTRRAPLKGRGKF